MKPKLLITMGDSNTEGVGCWGDGITDFAEKSVAAAKSVERFHNFGWPALLQKKINYNYLINLGKGGSSDSHQLKSFIENITDEELQTHDVLVIWVMTYAGRFSFYRNGLATSIQSAAVDNPPIIREFGTSYINFIEDLTKDSALEQLYHIRIFDKLCKTNGINFLFATLDNLQRSFLYRNCEKYFNVYNNLDNYVEADLLEHKSIYPDLFNKPELKSRLCMHPNELGYEVMANHIYTIMQDNFSYLINRNEIKQFKQEWRDVNQW